MRHDIHNQETRVGVLTEKNGSPVYVTRPTGEGRVRLGAGDRVMIQNGNMSPVSEFNLEQFYEVCPISDGLAPAEAEAIATEPTPTQSTWQLIRGETEEALIQQQSQGTVPEDNGADLCEQVKPPPKEKKARTGPRFNINFGGGGGGGRPPVRPGGRP